ncbi:MAG: hypothetical protein H8E56_03570 [Candidatus Marinimicrobia bacterium]|nr:hypothetical protein [Candidatus Neomarinimicrobiota bacterium]
MERYLKLMISSRRQETSFNHLGKEEGKRAWKMLDDRQNSSSSNGSEKNRGGLRLMVSDDLLDNDFHIGLKPLFLI